MSVQIADPIFIAFVTAGGAAIGVLMTSICTSVNQALERNSKHKDMIFNAALSQARRHVELGMEIGKITGATVTVRDETILAADYYKWLSHLHQHGTLPKEAIEAEEASIKESEERERLAKEQAKVHNDRTVEMALSHPMSAKHLLSTTKDLSLFSEEQLTSLRETASASFY